MFIREACYDIDELVRENLHVHTSFSGCAKPEMRVRDIVRRANELGLERVALVDHFNSPLTPILEKNSADKFVVSNEETDVKFLFGSELSACGIGIRLESDEQNMGLDYRLYAANHYHLSFWEQPEDRSPRGYARHSLAVLSELVKSGKADCIAHPVMAMYIKAFEDKTSVTRAVSDNELGDIMTLAKENGVAWEINQDDALADAEFSKRFWDIGREVGEVFNFGTDAHTLESMDTKRRLPELKKLFCK